jgi:hypothetical protein
MAGETYCTPFVDLTHPDHIRDSTIAGPLANIEYKLSSVYNLDTGYELSIAKRSEHELFGESSSQLAALCPLG